VIRISTKSGDRAIAEFPPTSAALLIIRGTPGRQWHPRRRCWSFPVRHLDSVVEEFADMGFTVSVDGVTQHGGANPFPALQAAMDPVTWRNVSRALLEVLSPDNGGDSRLWRLLRSTARVAREERQNLNRQAS
jgi:hypothetical protein